MIPTFVAFLAPDRYVDLESVSDLDLDEWNDRYEWVSDDWNGIKDTLTPVSRTIETARGDCDDYAFVAASWALANDRSDVGIAVCFLEWHGLPLPRHLIAFDSERVYSSGDIREGSVGEYLESSKYSRAWRRRFRS